MHNTVTKVIIIGHKDQSSLLHHNISGSANEKCKEICQNYGLHCCIMEEK